MSMKHPVNVASGFDRQNRYIDAPVEKSIINLQPMDSGLKKQPSDQYMRLTMSQNMILSQNNQRHPAEALSVEYPTSGYGRSSNDEYTRSNRSGLVNKSLQYSQSGHQSRVE